MKHRAQIARVLLYSVLGSGLVVGSNAEAENLKKPCQRIVSYAPSITALVERLGLGSQLVGLTSYCKVPTDAGRPQVIGGGPLDTSLETVVGLEPDMVLMLTASVSHDRFLQRRGINSRVVDHRSLEGILKSVTTIGELCKRGKRATALRLHFEKILHDTRERFAQLSPLRTLVVVGELAPNGDPRGLYVSGRDGFYSSLLEVVGMENVYSGTTVSLPALSREGLLLLAPEAIIQILPPHRTKAVESQKKRWQRFSHIPAVETGQLLVLSAPYASVPGPDFPLLLHDIATFRAGGPLR